MRKKHISPDSALGLVSTLSFPAIVGTADMMLKSAEVILVGYEKIGSGHCTAIVRGNIADVRLAVEEGARMAEQIGQLHTKLVIPRPMPNLEAVFPIGSRLIELAQQKRGYSRLSNRSIGLIETRGFPAMVGAADMMLKSADVQLASYETIGSGLCTAIIRGTVANVAVAIEAGMAEAERIGELNSVMIIPRLLEDLEHTLPVANYWLEEEERQQPLPNFAAKKRAVSRRKLVALPELEKVPVNFNNSAKVELKAELENRQQEKKPLPLEIIEPQTEDD